MKSAVNTSLRKLRGTKDSNYRKSNFEGIEAAEYHAVKDVTQCSKEISLKPQGFPGN